MQYANDFKPPDKAVSITRLTDSILKSNECKDGLWSHSISVEIYFKLFTDFVNIKSVHGYIFNCDH